MADNMVSADLRIALHQSPAQTGNLPVLRRCKRNPFIADHFNTYGEIITAITPVP